MTDHRDRDDDVRRLLSTLQDPGPMPADLVRRISASLAEEQARREREPHVAHVHSLDEVRERSLLRRSLPAIAVAASVAVLAGAAVMGILGTGLFGGQSDSVAGAESATNSTHVAAAQERSAESAAEDSAAEAFGGTDELLEDDSRAADGSGAATQDNSAGSGPYSASTGPHFLASGTLVTAATLDGLVVELRARSPLPDDPEARRALDESTVHSPAGAATCLEEITDEPAAEIEPRIDVVDIVQFEGALRALIVVTDAAAAVSAPEKPATAYLVPVDCRPGAASLLREPLRVKAA